MEWFQIPQENLDTITSCENKLLELWKHEILNFSLVNQTRRMWAIWDKSFSWDILQ